MSDDSELEIESLQGPDEFNPEGDQQEVVSEVGVDKETGGSCWTNNFVRVAVGIVIILAFYFCLYLVISHTRESRLKNDEGTTVTRYLSPGNTSCGANSFMIRDTVCDEATNIEKCLYDGGDCCLELKDTTLCKNCSCRLKVELDELQLQFDELNVKPIKNPDWLINKAIGDWIVEVESVVSGQVCAVLCLDHDKGEAINSWIFDSKTGNGTCRCGWTNSIHCPENLVETEIGEPHIHVTETLLQPGNLFFQLQKTVPCGCLAFDFLVNGEDTVKSKKEALTDGSSTKSAWHCQQKCQNDEECILFSWQYLGSDGGECRNKKIVDTSEKFSLEPGWISSTKDCSSFFSYFSRYTNDDGTLSIVCPDIDGIKGNLTVTQSDADFILLAQDTKAAKGAIRVKQGFLLACSHTMSTLSSGIHGISGGIMAGGSDFSVLVCGGQEEKTNVKHDQCHILNGDPTDWPTSGGVLQVPRVGAASLVTDNRTSLWVTGGFNNDKLALETTEFVKLQDSTLESSYGPNLPNPDGLKYHCLEKTGSASAIVIGGQDKSNRSQSLTWSVDIATMAWKLTGSLNTNKSRHACGVLRDESEQGKLIVVAAGGVTEKGFLTSTVELLILRDDNNAADKIDPVWRLGPNLPTQVSNAASATTSGQQKLFVIGGKQDSSSVFELQCDLLDCFWKTMTVHGWTSPTANSLALSLPPTPEFWQGDIGWCSYVDGDRGNESLLIVTTGETAKEYIGATDVIKVWNLAAQESNCYYSEWHTEALISGATGGLLRITPIDQQGSRSISYVPIFCGGLRNGNVEPETMCYQLGLSGHIRELTSKRSGAASVVIDNGQAMWITGGFDGAIYSETFDMIIADANGMSFDTSSLDRELNLAQAMAHHCLEVIDQSLAILYGGHNSTGVASESWTMDINTSWKQGWQSRASMTVARYNHACGVIKTSPTANNAVSKVVAAAGGFTSQTLIVDSVELLSVGPGNVISQAWIFGPKMPVSLAGTASATTKDQTLLFVAGGIKAVELFEVTNSVFTFQCLDIDNCQWTKMDQELRHARANSVAFVFPPISIDDIRNDGVEQEMDESICSFFDSASEEELLILTTGYNGEERTRETQVIAISNRDNDALTLSLCNPNDYWNAPRGLEMASGSLLELQDGSFVPVFCGGYTSDDDPDPTECYTLGSMIQGEPTSRVGAASLVLGQGETLWITGGNSIVSSLPLDTTTLYEFGRGGQLADISLPERKSFHCLEKISDDLAILYGGEGYKQQVSDKSWSIGPEFGIDNVGDWIPLASLSKARSRHMCGVLNGSIVIAAGGINSINQTIDTVELFYIMDHDPAQLTNQSWIPGPEMPLALAGAVSATVKEQTKLVIVGGVAVLDSSEISKTVLVLSCFNMDCHWTINNFELPYSRAYSLGFVLPGQAMISVSGVCPFLGDGYCDGNHNNKHCLYDGGDCCLVPSDCLVCALTDCICNETGEEHCACTSNWFKVGDGNCDEDLNISECFYDSGDCGY